MAILYGRFLGSGERPWQGRVRIVTPHGVLSPQQLVVECQSRSIPITWKYLLCMRGNRCHHHRRCFAVSGAVSPKTNPLKEHTTPSDTHPSSSNASGMDLHFDQPSIQQTKQQLPSRPASFLPPHLECLQWVLSPARLKRPPLGLAALAVFPVLPVLLLERHKSNMLRRQRLLPVLGKQVVRHVLEMGLLSCYPAQLAIVSQMGELCGVFLEISRTSQDAAATGVRNNGTYRFNVSLLSSSCRSSFVLASRIATLVTARSAVYG